MTDALRIGLVQMASVAAPDRNLARLHGWFGELAGRCDLVILPENCLCLGRGETVRQAARSVADWQAELGERVAGLAIPVLFGGVPVAEGAAVLNAALLYGPDGRLLARYDKIHLFQLDPAKPSGIDETRWYTPGSEPVAVTLNGWKIGLSICYDLRFPELYRHYAPADLLVCTAAFTEATGRAHWEVLLRARAIENQCFMAGVGQCGTNPETGQPLFGHTCLVDPWGEEVVAVPGGTEGLAVTALARTRLDEVRARLPALQHRRLQ